MKAAKVHKPSDPVVSVITPVFNAADVLTRTIASVQAQTFENWELILIDDGSTDESAATCAKLVAEDPRLRLFRQNANTGAAAARNAGLNAANGRYVAFLDADDEWLPTKLQEQLDFMRAKRAVFSYTDFWRSGDGKKYHVRVPDSVDRAELLKGNAIGCLTAMYDRDHFGNMQMPDLRMRQDWALWLLLLTQTERAYGLNKPLAVHHVHQGSLSSSLGKSIKANWVMYTEHLGLSAPRAAWYLGHHLMRRLRRG